MRLVDQMWIGGEGGAQQHRRGHQRAAALNLQGRRRLQAAHQHRAQSPEAAGDEAHHHRAHVAGRAGVQGHEADAGEGQPHSPEGRDRRRLAQEQPGEQRRQRDPQLQRDAEQAEVMGQVEAGVDQPEVDRAQDQHHGQEAFPGRERRLDPRDQQHQGHEEAHAADEQRRQGGGGQLARGVVDAPDDHHHPDRGPLRKGECRIGAAGHAAELSRPLANRQSQNAARRRR